LIGIENIEKIMLSQLAPKWPFRGLKPGAVSSIFWGSNVVECLLPRIPNFLTSAQALSTILKKTKIRGLKKNRNKKL
jgi:hypothetical protein